MSDELTKALTDYPNKANTKAEAHILHLLTTNDPVDFNQMLADVAQEVQDAKDARKPPPPRPE